MLTLCQLDPQSWQNLIFAVAVVMAVTNIGCGVGLGDAKVVSYYVIIIKICCFEEDDGQTQCWPNGQPGG